ncbi:MAG: hypothetical protein KAW02_00810 [candidate division Zixibacteria bacterium]|nr:hypothetical protein [candidate division Zixibacteria bacterium]
MDFKGYFNTINKNGCPSDCVLKKNGKIALIPPPDEILGIMISRDPTVRWLPQYEKYEGNREKLFETEAIPKLLIRRIAGFMKNYLTENDKEGLYATISQKTYWTHLHKCFTGAPKKGFTEFKHANAIKCADQWLSGELDHIINDKPKFILALGKDVEDWVKGWREKRKTEIEIINLLHPSPQNNLIWTRKAKEIIKKTEESIWELMKYAR